MGRNNIAIGFPEIWVIWGFGDERVKKLLYSRGEINQPSNSSDTPMNRRIYWLEKGFRFATKGNQDKLRGQPEMRVIDCNLPSSESVGQSSIKK